MTERNIGIILGEGLWGARCHERVATGVAVRLAGSFDKELHVVHTWSLESKRRKASLATEGEATCMLSKDGQDWRTLTRNQSQPGHSLPLVGLAAGPNCGQTSHHQEVMRCGIDWSFEVVGYSLKNQVHSSQICFRSRCSRCWRCDPALRHLATVCHAERGAVSIGDSPQR
jgi:hypothetical protein